MSRRATSIGYPMQQHRYVFWIGVLTLFLSLLMPMISVQTADAAAAAAELAQGVPPECDEGYEVNQEGTECVPIQQVELPEQEPETPICGEGEVLDPSTNQCVPAQPECGEGEIFDPNAGQCVPDPALQQVPESYVEIDKYDCPTGTDWSNVTDYAILTAPGACVLNQAPVSISVNNDVRQITSSGEWGPYEDTTSYQIGEQVPQGYNLPHIFCGGYTPGTNQPSLNYFGASDQVVPQVNPGESLYCAIFNHQEAEQSGTVTVYKWDCAPGTEYGQNQPYYQGEGQDEGPCETEHLNIPISLIDANGPRETTTQANGTQWNGVVPDQNGSFQIAETIPQGYGEPMVFCGTLDQETQQPMSPTGGIVTLTPTTPSFDYQCNWYNIAEGEYNYLDFYKYECTTAAAEGADKSWYEQNCQQPMLDIPFHLNGGTDTTDQNGHIGWSGLPTGTWTAVEEVPNGYGDPIVWCRYTEWPDGAGVTGDWAMFEAPGGVYENGFGYDDMRMECHWYNIPANDNTITVYKWDCVEGTQYGQGLPYYQGEGQDEGPCETEHLDIPMTLTDANGDRTVPTQANGTQWNNVALGQNGSFQVSEENPAGYGEPMVFCGTLDEETQQLVTATGGTVTLTPANQPFDYQCNWYNIQTAPYAQILIEKYWCEEGYAPASDAEQSEIMGSGSCQQTGPQTTFSLTGPSGPYEDMSIDGSPGATVTWPIFEGGEYTVTENIPDGEYSLRVYCHTSPLQVNGNGLANPELWEVINGNSIQWTAEEGYYWICTIFNIPANDNTVTVYKWDCAPATEYGRDLEYYQGGLPDQEVGPCESEHLNVPISLIDANGPRATTTQANGTQWNGVVPDQNGSFQIAEMIPQGYGEPMVFCGTLDQETQQLVTAAGGSITLTPASEPFDYQCSWYNIPADGEYQLELYKYVCSPEVDRNLGLPDLGTTCMPAQGVSFTATFGTTPTSARYTDSNGQIVWTDAPAGDWSLQETMTPGWGAPKVFCGAPQTAEAPEVPVVDLTVTGILGTTSPHTICYWFNFEVEYENGRITVYKYQCPPETTSKDLALLQESCTTPLNGVGFELQTGDTVSSASTVGGVVDWVDLDQGTYTVTEDLLPGYEQPLVWCGYVMQDGADIDPVNYEFTSYPVIDGGIQLELNNFPARIVCYWYNFPTGYGEITIYKWLCPPGYDIEAWGADPKMDCTTPQNGVTFTLDQLEGADQLTDTGDSIPGAVYFGGLNPGAYTVTETVPPDIDHVFVLDCTGTDIPKVHQYPLSWGNRLDVNVAGGDSIVCNWYNVPNPENGWATVYKYQCWTSTFTTEVDCEIYEHGATFELFGLPGETSYGVGTTNEGGLYTWNDLPEGGYTIEEISHQPCKMTTTKVDGAGNIRVDDGEGTVIKVYNCKSSTPTTPVSRVPGKVPGKYPNTGAGPSSSDDFMPAIQETTAGTATPGAGQDELVNDYYRISCLEGTPAPSPEATEPADAEATATIAATEEVFDLPIDADETSTLPADGTPGPEEECARGALPVRVEVDAASVDAGVETLEIVDGIMQQPTGPSLVAWYKETGRLGETNNVVIAGHLNWWNVPEGVFFNLQDLQEGERVEITGDDGMVYIYEIEWVRQESNLEPPAADVIGPTDAPSLTLITCGGEWDASIAEYNERTVVRAAQVDVIAADESPDESD